LILKTSPATAASRPGSALSAGATVPANTKMPKIGGPWCITEPCGAAALSSFPAQMAPSANNTTRATATATKNATTTRMPRKMMREINCAACPSRSPPSRKGISHRLLGEGGQPSPAMAEMDFWYEFGSTYSYPAAMRIERLVGEAAVALRWRPSLLGPIFKAYGWNDSPFNIFAAKGRYMWRDLARV